MDAKLRKRAMDEYNKRGETTSATSNDTMSEVEQIQKPRSGGIFTYLKGHLFPMKGFISQAEMEGLNKSKDMILRLIMLAHKFIKPKLKDPIEYSGQVREMYRVFNEMIARENPTSSLRKKWAAIRDILCYCVDGDKAYFFRFLDAVSIADMSKLKKDKGDEHWMARRRGQGKYNYGGLIEDWDKKLDRSKGNVKRQKEYK